MQDPKPWQVLRCRYLVKDQPFLQLREDCVQLPNGACIDPYFVFEYPDWVAALAITTAGELIFVRQYRHGIAGVHYELPAGVVDAGEMPLAGAQRELLEETGYGGGVWQPFVVTSADPATHTNRCHIFLATGVVREREPEQEDTEDMTIHLLSPQEARAALHEGGIMQAMHAAALWRWFAEEHGARSPTLPASH